MRGRQAGQTFIALLAGRMFSQYTALLSGVFPSPIRGRTPEFALTYSVRGYYDGYVRYLYVACAVIADWPPSALDWKGLDSDETTLWHGRPWYGARCGHAGLGSERADKLFVGQHETGHHGRCSSRAPPPRPIRGLAAASCSTRLTSARRGRAARAVTSRLA